MTIPKYPAAQGGHTPSGEIRSSQAQIVYACDLLDSRNLMADDGFKKATFAMTEQEMGKYVQDIKDGLPLISKGRCSDIIRKLVALPPLKKKNTEPWKVQRHEYRDDPRHGDRVFLWLQRIGGKGVPRGSYALESKDLSGHHTNEIIFYNVWISDDGSRWSVKMYSSDNLVPLRRAFQYEVLEVIGQAPDEAAARYGLHTSKCGICGRKLTNDGSRERGIGPVCAENWGW